MANNQWTDLSIQYANQKNYLDALFKIYPIPLKPINRELNKGEWECVVKFYKEKKFKEIILSLCNFERFPIDNPYISYIKQDNSSLDRNPETILRIGSYICNDMTLEDIHDGLTQPMQSSRMMGHLFKNFINKETLGIKVFHNEQDFLDSSEKKKILSCSDAQLYQFSHKFLGYTQRDSKGIDFIAKIDKCWVVGEAKFITANGGAQNNQLIESAQNLLDASFKANDKCKVIPIVIVDGVPYVENCNGKLQRTIRNKPDKIFISAILLRDFLFSL